MGYLFGKLEAKNSYKTLRFDEFVESTLAPPPLTYNAFEIARTKIATTPSIDILCPMDGNDRYGDCVAAGLVHAIAINQALIGKWDVLPEAQVIALYFKLSGGQDSGLVMLDTLNYWRKNRVAGDNILGYAKLDKRNHVAVKQAIKIFGGVYLGFQVQQNAMSDFEAHRTWTPGRLLNAGHCVYAYAYDDATVTVSTWAAGQKGTWAWWDQCVDESYVLLAPETLVAGFSPGFNFAAFQKALKEVTA